MINIVPNVPLNAEEKTVAEFVSLNINTAHVFKKHGIDFCCGGGVSVQEVCSKKGIDFANLMTELETVGQTKKANHDFNSWELTKLINYIIDVHHQYVKENIQIMIQYADKVARVHGHHYNELLEINKLVHIAIEEMQAHLQKEEQILFPYIVELERHKKQDVGKVPIPFGTVKNPINMMEEEHEVVGDIFKRISTLSNTYTPPEGACNTYRAFFHKLDEFEQDLHLHIHLENNILHPKAIALEIEVNQ
jgi:regulator of cell morphogenesis and NO signaling